MSSLAFTPPLWEKKERRDKSPAGVLWLSSAWKLMTLEAAVWQWNQSSKPDTWCEGRLTDVLSSVVPRKRRWLQVTSVSDSSEKLQTLGNNTMSSAGICSVGALPQNILSPGASNKCPHRSSRESGSISSLLTQAILLAFLSHHSFPGKFPYQCPHAIPAVSSALPVHLI